jgi:hypothetical protein
MPYVQGLVDLWGQPDMIATHWWDYPVAAALEVGTLAVVLDFSWRSAAGIYGGAIVLLPGPRQTYLWLKDPYCIEVQTNRALLSLYEREVVRWEWSAVGEEGKLSERCKLAYTRKKTLPADGSKATGASADEEQ